MDLKITDQTSRQDLLHIIDRLLYLVSQQQDYLRQSAAIAKRAEAEFERIQTMIKG